MHAPGSHRRSPDLARRRRRRGHARSSRRRPRVALTYNGGTYAVMMATPQDLRGFRRRLQPRAKASCSRADEISSLEVVPLDDGIELRMWLDAAQAERLSERRRHIAGPTGCGLCGIDSIARGGAARRDRRRKAGRSRRSRSWRRCRPSRRCRRSTSRPARCTRRRSGPRPAASSRLREDVGRHNALDKLAGALARRPGSRQASGMVLLTSRVSVEMVQKTAAIGAPVMVAVSAPTALAVRTADAAGITLVGDRARRRI